MAGAPQSAVRWLTSARKGEAMLYRFCFLDAQDRDAATEEIEVKK
jgi:hypothetical protein